METNVTKLRDSNPLVNVMMADLWEVLSDNKFNGMSVAETVGALMFIQNDLMNGEWGG